MATTAENFFGSTDTGKLRDNNEDAFFAQKVWDNKYIAACVIDGVGGYEGGEVAAQIAKETLLEHLQDGGGEVLEKMKKAINIANFRIYNERAKSQEHQSMACVLTLALADIEKNEFYYAHIGDTRLYLFRDHSLVKVTKDHSFVGFLEDSKRLSEEEAMRHPKRNEINKALGFDPSMILTADYTELGHSPFLPGDLLLLCSDGLTDLVDSNSIKAVLSTQTSLQQKCKQLIDAANEAGGKDNITVVLVQNDKKPVELEATKPLPLKKKDVPGVPVKASVETNESSGIIPSKKRSSNGAIIILTLLSLALGGYIIWDKILKKNNEKVIVIPLKNKNLAEQKLMDSINGGTKFLLLNDSVYGTSITLTDTIIIQKDSIHINGSNLILRSDSSYKGPAFIINNSKYVILENIVFENFDQGIISIGNALQLKNVRFLNCRVPVAAQFFPGNDLPITGFIRDSIFKADSIQKQIQ